MKIKYSGFLILLVYIYILLPSCDSEKTKTLHFKVTQEFYNDFKDSIPKLALRANILRTLMSFDTTMAYNNHVEVVSFSTDADCQVLFAEYPKNDTTVIFITPNNGFKCASIAQQSNLYIKPPTYNPRLNYVILGQPLFNNSKALFHELMHQREPSSYIEHFEKTTLKCDSQQDTSYWCTNLMTERNHPLSFYLTKNQQYTFDTKIVNTTDNFYCDEKAEYPKTEKALKYLDSIICCPIKVFTDCEQFVASLPIHPSQILSAKDKCSLVQSELKTMLEGFGTQYCSVFLELDILKRLNQKLEESKFDMELFYGYNIATYKESPQIAQIKIPTKAKNTYLPSMIESKLPKVENVEYQFVFVEKPQQTIDSNFQIIIEPMTLDIVTIANLNDSIIANNNGVQTDPVKNVPRSDSIPIISNEVILRGVITQFFHDQLNNDQMKKHAQWEAEILSEKFGEPVLTTFKRVFGNYQKDVILQTFNYYKNKELKPHFFNDDIEFMQAQYESFEPLETYGIIYEGHEYHLTKTELKYLRYEMDLNN